jgi:hypothetical protein
MLMRHETLDLTSDEPDVSRESLPLGLTLDGPHDSRHSRGQRGPRAVGADGSLTLLRRGFNPR